MKLTRVIAIGVIFGTVALSALNAQTLRKSAPPTEFPPASYKGKQYVDSRGCIYIRAGIDGNVTWVPRVSRSRKQVCGYKPTAVAGSTAAPARATGAGAPVIITANPPANAPPAKSAAKPPVAAPKRTAIAPAPVVQPRPAPAAVAATSAPAKPTAAPAATVIAGPKRATTKSAAATKPVTTATATPAKPSPAPAATVVTGPKSAATQPVAPPRPVAGTATTVRAAPDTPSPGPAATVFTGSTAGPKPVIATAKPTTPMAVTSASPASRKPSPAPAATLVAGPKAKAPTSVAAAAPVPQAEVCSNASGFSQKFINQRNNGRFKVRCGPQTEVPITYAHTEKHSAAAIAPSPAAAPTNTADTRVVAVAPPAASSTRVVKRHIYDKRQNTTNVAVPSGYKTVWQDDRLNTHRAERTLQPAVVQRGISVPRGYKVVDWEDNRLNPTRGRSRTAQGDAQTSLIWTNTVPRRLIQVPTQARVVSIPKGTSKVQDPQTTVARVSTRSAPVVAPASTSAKRIYVRVATYVAESDARSTALALARAGLPMRLGTVKPSGKKVVLAGPFASNAQAKAALKQVRGAGFRRARISK